MTSIDSAEDVIAVAKARGFEVRINPGPPPMPFLRGDKKDATPALLAALKAWRLEIIELLKKQQPEQAKAELEKP